VPQAGARVGQVAPPVFSGGQALASNAGRVVAPLAAGWLITTAGYGPAFGLVAARSLATAWLLVGTEGATEQLGRGTSAFRPPSRRYTGDPR
jgi:hypothetical protein